MSPLAKASITVFGMMCIRKSVTLCALACPAYSATAFGSSVAGLILNPLPGFTTFPTTRPITRAMRGYHFKVEQRLAAHAPDLLHVLHPGDAGDHGAEDHQRDDHGDQANERVAERLHGDRFRRADIAQNDGNRDGEQHLCREALVDRPTGRTSGLPQVRSSP